MKENRMKIRTYQEKDYKALYALYNKVFYADPVSEEFFLEHLILSPNFQEEGVFLAEEDGLLKGALVSQIEKGYLNPYTPPVPSGTRAVSMMPPLVTDLETGRALLEEAEKYFKAQDRNFVKVASYGPTLFPDSLDKDAYPLIVELLEEASYTFNGCYYSMGRSLINYKPSEKIREKIRAAAERGIYAKVCEFADVEAVKKFFQNGGLKGRVLNLVQKIRAHELDQVIIIRNEEEVLGYCQYKYYDDAERVGPFGVAQKMRGQGLGQVMVAKLLEVMAMRGFHYVYFASCSEANTHFYGKNGFEVFRVKNLYYKEI